MHLKATLLRHQPPRQQQTQRLYHNELTLYTQQQIPRNTEHPQRNTESDNNKYKYTQRSYVRPVRKANNQLVIKSYTQTQRGNRGRDIVEYLWSVARSSPQGVGLVTSTSLSCNEAGSMACLPTPLVNMATTNSHFCTTLWWLASSRTLLKYHWSTLGMSRQQKDLW